ncbi:ParB/RepB/Spo0J family partition protein [Segniliparus rugosus]|uniref:ParB-like partition protein n=1 Tax=Segniliparus rugosus (strain ATCC BAA-974 / DSM 45345 / CCUG 50838 / CIP 108380 / JCM 13579 / CDC 945) TaxID=679197 RepID=E5XV88_SEGRC|nr:ParB/RepB/Spo0J family partition protein [Segniliparus rugosus]EFV11701.1 ParB-like partition protein [Segniliparus rugosus ATCC BAA-974]
MANQRKGGLGRGLAALIPAGPGSGPRLGDSAADVLIPPNSGSAMEEGQLASYQEIDVELIEPNPQQPRHVFDEEALAELTHSIREFGLLQPVVVRPVPGGYQLVVGERRLRATKAAGLTSIPAIVKHTADDILLRDALIENIHRAQLNPLEEAAAYQQLLEDFGATHEQLAERLGRSRSLVSNTLRLLRLPVGVQRKVAAGVLSAGHARALLGLDGNLEAQEDLASRIVAEGMSVRAAEEAVTLSSHKSKAKPKGRGKPAPPAELEEVADRLALALDTTVHVGLTSKKGRIVIEFGSVPDLERIADLIAPRPGEDRSRGRDE